MPEITFVRPQDHAEVYVNYNGKIPTDVYTHKDSIPNIPNVTWIKGLNNLFLHANNPTEAEQFLRLHFILTDDELDPLNDTNT